MSVKDGGRAFPLSRETEGWYEAGMLLRDYFAAQELPALVEFHQPTSDRMIGQIASDAYRIADAMLKERNQ